MLVASAVLLKGKNIGGKSVKLFAIIKFERNVPLLLSITDVERRATEELEMLRKATPEETILLLSTENVNLSLTGMSGIAADYDLHCLEETARNRLQDRFYGENAPETAINELAEVIAAEAFQDIFYENVPEADALDKAFSRHDEEILALEQEAEDEAEAV